MLVCSVTDVHSQLFLLKLEDIKRVALKNDHLRLEGFIIQWARIKWLMRQLEKNYIWWEKMS